MKECVKYYQLKFQAIDGRYRWKREGEREKQRELEHTGSEQSRFSHAELVRPVCDVEQIMPTK